MRHWNTTLVDSLIRSHSEHVWPTDFCQCVFCSCYTAAIEYTEGIHPPLEISLFISSKYWKHSWEAGLSTNDEHRCLLRRNYGLLATGMCLIHQHGGSGGQRFHLSLHAKLSAQCLSHSRHTTHFDWNFWNHRIGPWLLIWSFSL